MVSDAHATGEGYLRSPRDGSLRDIVRTTLAMEHDSGVVVQRRLGVSVATYLFAGELGDNADWGGEWIENEPTGPQGWWPAAMCDVTMLRGLRSLGMRWVCVGSTAGPETERLVAAAREIGLGVALRPSTAAVEEIEARGPSGMTIESLPMLLDVLIAQRTGQQPTSTISEALRRIATTDQHVIDESVAWIIAARITVVALLTAASCQVSLRTLVHAPQLAAAARVLPYHDRIASLRAPGAMRMGGKEAALHLGVPILDRSAEREAATGLDRCRAALSELLEAHADVRVGSGAPGMGLAPGPAVNQEAETFAGLEPVEVRHG